MRVVPVQWCMCALAKISAGEAGLVGYDIESSLSPHRAGRLGDGWEENQQKG